MGKILLENMNVATFTQKHAFLHRSTVPGRLVRHIHRTRIARRLQENINRSQILVSRSDNATMSLNIDLFKSRRDAQISPIDDEPDSSGGFLAEVVKTAAKLASFFLLAGIMVIRGCVDQFI